MEGGNFILGKITVLVLNHVWPVTVIVFWLVVATPSSSGGSREHGQIFDLELD